MKPFARHTEYRPELEGMDPLAMLIIPLAILLLSLLVIRAIVVASVV
jgi:hypothetical protein